MAFAAEFWWVWLVGIGGFVLLWPVSVVKRDASVVDFWWGPGVGAMALAMVLAQDAPLSGLQWAILLPLLVWAVRLGAHLGWRRVHEGDEDPRYRDLRAAWSPGWAWKSLFIVFLLQGVLQAVIAWGVLAGLHAAAGQAATAPALILALLALVAVAVETRADLELDRFRRTATDSALLTGGLRAYVRHPNYAAEIAVWICLSLLAVLAGIVWAPVSAAIVAILLRYVSGVTILDERLESRGADYRRYRDHVPALIPRLRPYAGGPARAAE